MKIKKNITVFLVIIFACLIVVINKFDNKFNDDINIVSESEKGDSDYSINNNEENNEKLEITTEELNEEKDNLDKQIKELIIQVSGEVKNPGVITTTSDKRLIDVVDELGGLTKDADLTKVNLSVRLEDEKNYIIPNKNDESVVQNNNDTNNSSANSSSGEEPEKGKININTASIDELDTLPGVGEATAQKIMSYREENGAFNTMEEIKNVNGIGDKKFDDLKEYITVQ